MEFQPVEPMKPGPVEKAMPVAHTLHPVGSEVQLKSQPGFPWKVIASIKNERSLQAVDESALALALVHEIEPYCDVEQFHFMNKVTALLKRAGAADAAELVARDLWEKGARFPEKDAKPAPLTDAEIAALVLSATRKILSYGHMKFTIPKGQTVEDYLVSCWSEGHGRISPAMDLARAIIDESHGCKSSDALEAVYAHAIDPDF